MGKGKDINRQAKGAQQTPKTVVVGIGGSAGSLDALEQFLSALPADSGLALAVALHSSSERAEGLADFLAKYSAMPAQAVDEGAEFQPNIVHVIRFDQEQDGGLHRIDRFFCRVAKKYGEKAIALILSGGGADGAAGARAIEAAGGAVFIQDPATALHPEMPRNARLACHAAEVLAPELLAAKVLEIARVTGPELSVDEQSEQLRKIFRMVKMRTGNDFSAYKPNTVLRRIDRRMKANAVKGVVDYVNLLEESPGEARALSQDFCIGVTLFFRE